MRFPALCSMGWNGGCCRRRRLLKLQERVYGGLSLYPGRRYSRSRCCGLGHLGILSLGRFELQKLMPGFLVVHCLWLLLRLLLLRLLLLLLLDLQGNSRVFNLQ